jgi:hypothetical protein
MKYAAEMGSAAMMYIPSFIKICSGIQKLSGGYTDTQTHGQHGDSIKPHLFLFQNKESTLKSRTICERNKTRPIVEPKHN